MYVYLYENFLKKKKYEKVIQEIETRLTDYGVAGKIVRLQNFSNSEAVIEEEIRRGAKTIVIVGNDETFGRVLSRGAKCDTVFGFLPIGMEDNSIAGVLGIPIGVDSCDVLARRRKVRLDVGWFNNRYFVSRLHIQPSNIRVEYDEQFTVSADYGKMELVVCNLQPFHWKGGRKANDIIIHPQDGKLEAFLRPVIGKGVFRDKYGEPSMFPFEEMVVTSQDVFEVEADGKTSKEKKITIRLAKNRIEMIVGKERKF